MFEISDIFIEMELILIIFIKLKRNAVTVFGKLWNELSSKTEVPF